MATQFFRAARVIAGGIALGFGVTGCSVETVDSEEEQEPTSAEEPALGFPLDLRGVAPQSASATITVTKPAGAASATLQLSIFDADNANEGQLKINGGCPLTLWGAQGNHATNDEVVRTVSYNVAASCFQNGNNTLAFTHTGGGSGYRVESAPQVTFGGSPPAGGGYTLTEEWSTKPGTWSYAGTPSTDAAPQGGVSPSGGPALKFSYPAGTHASSVGGGVAGYESVPNIQDLYWGSWIKWSSPTNFNPIGSKIYYQYGNPTATVMPRMTIRVGQNTGRICCEVDIGVNPGLPNKPLPHTVGRNQATVQLNAGQWYWLETRTKANTPGQQNGILEVWVNDVRTHFYTNVRWFDHPTVQGRWHWASLAPVWGGGGGTINQIQHLWYDHTVISGARIGMPK